MVPWTWSWRCELAKQACIEYMRKRLIEEGDCYDIEEVIETEINCVPFDPEVGVFRGDFYGDEDNDVSFDDEWCSGYISNYTQRFV